MVSIRTEVSDEKADRLRALALKEDRSVAWIVRRAIDRELQVDHVLEREDA